MVFQTYSLRYFWHANRFLLCVLRCSFIITVKYFTQVIWKWIARGKGISKPSRPSPQQETRACATVCPASMEATARCGQCDFNATTHMCVVTGGPRGPVGTVTEDALCSTAEEVVHSGDVNARLFVGKGCWALCPCCRPSERLLLRTPLLSVSVMSISVNQFHHSFRPTCCTIINDTIWM